MCASLQRACSRTFRPLGVDGAGTAGPTSVKLVRQLEKIEELVGGLATARKPKKAKA